LDRRKQFLTQAIGRDVTAPVGIRATPVLSMIPTNLKKIHDYMADSTSQGLDSQD
jgi:hypothetical protein